MDARTRREINEYWADREKALVKHHNETLTHLCVGFVVFVLVFGRAGIFSERFWDWSFRAPKEAHGDRSGYPDPNEFAR